MRIGESVAINYIVKLIVNVVLDFSRRLKTNKNYKIVGL